LTAGAEPASWGAEEIMDLFDLSGKVAVVTGGNGGIGLAMAAGMAEAGASILVAGRDAAKSVDAVAALKETGAQADRFELDVTDEDACRALMQAAADRFGRLDILVNNAGMSIRKRPELYTLADWKLTKTLPAAWAGDNIQVNAVLPGWIDTALTRQARIDIPDLNDRVHARTPEGRWGEPDDHKGVAVFLASAASNFVTGASIPVDGGYAISG
jgi:2-deoxy-D-gluconate 3-dehydrogenase